MSCLVVSWHVMTCHVWNGMAWNGMEQSGGMDCTHVCVCMCTHVRRYYKKVLMLAHDEYMWQQTYSLRFYAQGESREIDSIEWNECYCHSKAAGTPWALWSTFSCLSFRMSSWVRFLNSLTGSPTITSWIGPPPRRIVHDRLAASAPYANCGGNYAGWTAPDWDYRMGCWVKYLCLREAYGKSIL